MNGILKNIQNVKLYFFNYRVIDKKYIFISRPLPSRDILQPKSLKNKKHNIACRRGDAHSVLLIITMAVYNLNPYLSTYHFLTGRIFEVFNYEQLPIYHYYYEKRPSRRK